VPGYRLSGWTGAMFLFRIMVGAVAPLNRNEPTPPYVTAELNADPSRHRDIRRLLRRRERLRSRIDIIGARPT